MQLTRNPLGEVRRRGDTVEIVFTRRFRRPIEAVWAALTVPERIGDWFADATIDRLQVGGRIELYFTGADYRSLAVITDCAPPRRLAWTWSDMDGSKASQVRFDLAPDGADACVLTLTHTELAAGEADGVAAGWHAHLEAVEDACDGVRTSWATLLEREAMVNAAYRSAQLE